MKRTQTLLFLAVFLSLAALDHSSTGWNLNTRLSLVFAVVDEGTLQIDAYHDVAPTRTMDKSVYEGHYYSDKVIGLPMLAIPIYAAMRVIWGAFGAEPGFYQANYLLRVVVVSSAAGISAVLLFKLLLLLGAEAKRAILAVVFTVFGSLFYGYASVFYPYVPGVASGLTALWLIASPGSGSLTGARSFAIGSLCGFAILCDFIFGIIVIGLALLYLVRLGSESEWFSWPSAATAFPSRCDGQTGLARLGLAALGGAIPLSIFAAYTYSIFGQFAIPYEFEALPGYRKGMAQGFMGVGAPQINALWYLTVHPLRGLFFWSPVLLFALAGCLYQMRSRGLERFIGILGIYTLIGYLIFNSGYFMWWGGWAMGPRLMLPIFIAFPLGLAYFCRLERSSRVWGSVAALGIVSIVLTLPVSLLDPQVPQFYSDRHYRSLRIGDSVRTPAFRSVEFFYNLGWRVADREDPSVPKSVSLSAACLIPAILIPIAIRSLPGRRDRSRNKP